MNKVSETECCKEDNLYHNTYLLLKKYRDVVWSMEVSVQHMRNQFKHEFGSTIEEYLDSIYLAGMELIGCKIENHTKSIERSYQMLQLLDQAVDLIRSKHRCGEAYYWILYYTYLSPRQLKNMEEVIEHLRPYVRDISLRTYYRKRKEAITALSSVLWGFTSRDSIEILTQFIPNN